MAYAPDPGAHFESDAHRRVLGHLSLPSDKFGWSVPALIERLKNTGLGFKDVEAELATVLGELKSSGFATDHDDKAVWQMTDEGLAELQAEVPEHALPATQQGATISAATPIGEPVAEAPGPAGPQPAQIVPEGADPAPAAEAVEAPSV